LAVPHDRQIQKTEMAASSTWNTQFPRRIVGATQDLERRFLEQEVFGYTIEKVTAATSLEAMCLPERCVMVLT
jgi:hypothetical protein